MNDESKKSRVAAGTDLWRTVTENGVTPLDWDAVAPEEQSAAVRAGSELWAEVVGQVER